MMLFMTAVGPLQCVLKARLTVMLVMEKTNAAMLTSDIVGMTQIESVVNETFMVRVLTEAVTVRTRHLFRLTPLVLPLLFLLLLLAKVLYSTPLLTKVKRTKVT